MTLSVIPLARRAAIAAGPRDRAEHARLLAELGFDAALDAAPASRPHPPRDALRVVAWNLERGRHVDESAALLAAAGADVLLLSELDWGMARSGQRHVARELAERLGCAYAYGVEFLELDLGGERERAACAGQSNSVGFHGNAVLARGELASARLARLERRGDWFDGARGERRVGGRCAVLAQVAAGGRPVTFAAAHLDSHGTRAGRAEEMRALLDAIDAYGSDAPALIGGDLNSFSLDLAEIGDRERVAAALREDPARWSHPVPHEPLFALAAGRGYEWAPCNAPGVATLRHVTGDGSARGALKLDWFLCRGLDTSAPRVLEAVGAGGRALSDHEPIAVEVRVRTTP
jgi:endonuclease/exonuclease/phosphatase family metal-dependent hydrolase